MRIQLCYFERESTNIIILYKKTQLTEKKDFKESVLVQLLQENKLLNFCL